MSCEIAGALRVLRAIWPESLAIVVVTPSSTWRPRPRAPCCRRWFRAPTPSSTCSASRFCWRPCARRTSRCCAKPRRPPAPALPRRIVPGLKEALELRHPSLLGVCLSGAGPSVVALAQQNLDEVSALLADIYIRKSIPFRIQTLRVHPTNKPAHRRHTCTPAVAARKPPADGRLDIRPMETGLLQISPEDRDAILALNNAYAIEMSWLDSARLRYLLENAYYARMAQDCSAFLIAFTPEASYDNLNFEVV